MMTETRFVHYKVGNEQHDNEHWELFVQLNGIIDCIKQRQYHLIDADKIASNLLKHFAEEHEHMVKMGFPYIDSHAKDHQRMLKRLSYLVNEAHDQHFLLVDMTARELENLFVDHIDHFDRQYADFERSLAHGLEPSLTGQASRE